MKKYIAGLLVLGLLSLGTYAANEVKAKLQVKVSKGQLDVDRDPGTIDIDMAGNAVSDNIDTFATNVITAITITASVATNGVAVFQNLTTNDGYSVDIGMTNGASFFRVLRIAAGEAWSARIHPTNTLMATANGGSCDLRTTVIED